MGKNKSEKGQVFSTAIKAENPMTLLPSKTAKRIAEEAGVSAPFVSMVMNGLCYSDKVAEIVIKEVRENKERCERFLEFYPTPQK